MTRRPSRKRERDELVAGLREHGNTWVEIAEVLRDLYGYNARAAVRLAHGWSQTRAAEEWSRRWPDDIKIGKNFSYWESWPESGHPPSLATLVKLAELYECALTHLVDGVADYSAHDLATGPDCGSPG